MKFAEQKIAFENKVKNIKFKTRGLAKRQTGLSYLGGTTISYKTNKGDKLGFTTYIIYLAPHKLSGNNTCPMATKGCISGCLNTSGRAAMQDEHGTISMARIKKTWLYFANREFFNAWMFAELAASYKLARQKKTKFAARINGTSDLPISQFSLKGVNVLDKFPKIKFYDYTKVYKHLNSARKNYHLTFSFSETNEKHCLEALGRGFNVAIPFSETLPKTWFGTNVIDGDESDLRFLDEKNSIVGLKVKRIKEPVKREIAKKEGFFVTSHLEYAA